MRTSYKILFSIEVLNQYFGTGRWKEVQIVPMPETGKLMKQYELTTRFIDNELLVVAKTDSAGKVFHELPLYEKLSFMLVPQTPNYVNFSNVPFAKLTTTVFHFHNLNNNEMGSKHFLTKTLADYVNTKSYMPGDLVKGAGNKIYESIKVNSAVSVAPPDADNWVLHNDLQYVSADDAKETFEGNEYSFEESGTIYNFKTSVKQKVHKVQVFALNPATLLYDKVVVSSEVTFDDNYDLVQVDMRQIPSGKYCIRVNNDVRLVYLNTGTTGYGMPMFIDIYNLPDTATQAIIDAAKKPKNIRLTVAFAARRVLWRYKTRTSTIDKIEDASATFTFKPDGLKKFISERPIPLSDTAIKTLVAKQGTLNITTPLPNPTPDRLSDKQNEIYSTEAFINF